MPQELPGFYYDAEKNRYFPIKGPIPGTSRPRPSSSTAAAAQKPNSKPNQASDLHKTRARTFKMLQVRELSGNVLSLTKGKHNFKEEFQKRLASQPTVWKYRTEKTRDGALERIRIGVITPEGQCETDVLLAGRVSGSLSFFEVGKGRQELCNGAKFTPKQVWPLTKGNNNESYKAPDLIWRAVVHMSSSVSCIRLSAKHSTLTTDNGFNLQHALITTLGSETSGGSVCVLNLADPLDYDLSTTLSRQRIQEVASLNCTIWTADYNADQAVVGTNLGAAVVNLETGMHSWVFRSKSDVLAQQLHSSGNVVLCGLRNGAILTVDIRERPEGFSNRLIRYRIPYSPSHGSSQKSKKQWFELRGNTCPSTVFMSSSVSSLVSLYDQYFLASSMDGSIKLYDHRLTQRGPVQSYEGHVNSHTRIQLGVDQSERFVMSGGEDCNLRIWSIKSGELLFEDKFSNSIPSNVCWRRPERFVGTHDRRQSDEEFQVGQSYSSDAWIQSQEGLFHMHWY